MPCQVSCVSLQAEGTETILLPLQLLLGTGRLLLEATAIQVMKVGPSFLDQPKKSVCR